MERSRYRLLMLQAFSLSPNSKYTLRPMSGPKETMLMNHGDFAPLLEGVDWDIHPGAPAPHGDWPVETREEFCLLSASRLPIVREACESGKYNGIVLLGGGDPGFPEAREIARRHGIAVTSNAHAQMHLACMLGNKFSILDITETHNMQMHALVVQYRFTERCASIRNMNFPLPRPPFVDQPSMTEEKRRAMAGDLSGLVRTAVDEAVAAIEEDGAEVLMLGCSAVFWLRPFVQKRLDDLGWEVPVLEGYSSAIAQAKMLIDLDVSASGLAFPGSSTQRWRRKKTF